MEERIFLDTKNDLRDTRNVGFDAPSQPIIMTSVVRQFLMMSFLLEQERTLPAIGIATGPAGIGKTVALSHLHHTLAQARVLQPSLVLTASPFLTPSRLVSQILQLLDIPPDRSGHSLSTTLHQQGICLLSIDNADFLRSETWEMLHVLSDETPCSLLLVGHPILHHHLEHHPYLIDRVNFLFDLYPASFDEMLHIILPHLTGDQWAFHAEKDEDRRLAEKLWLQVSPSFRQLQNILDNARALARMRHESSITPASLSHALQLLPRSMQNDTYEEKTMSVSIRRLIKKGSAVRRQRSKHSLLSEL